MNTDKHRKEILDAIALGLKIQFNGAINGWRELPIELALTACAEVPQCLRIAPGEREKLVRFYSNGVDDMPAPIFGQHQNSGDTHYIDYNPETGRIVGGRIE